MAHMRALTLFRLSAAKWGRFYIGAFLIPPYAKIMGTLKKGRLTSSGFSFLHLSVVCRLCYRDSRLCLWEGGVKGFLEFSKKPSSFRSLREPSSFWNSHLAAFLMSKLVFWGWF